MRQWRWSTLVALAAIGSLAGCGDAARGGPVATRPPVRSATASAAVVPGVTAGRLGDATRAAGERPERLLSRGGRLRPVAARPTPRQRAGLGAGTQCAGVEALPARDTLAQVGDATVCLLNGERADRGLPPLIGEGRLARAAGRHAGDMVARQYFSHVGADGSSLTDRIGAAGYLAGSARWVIGENLAWGTGALATPRAIVNAWMNSPGHRRNILDERFREIGIAVVLGNPASEDGAGATFATEFGRREDAVPRAPGSTRTSPAAASSGRSRALGVSARRTPARACRRLSSRRARVCRARAARLARAARRAHRARVALAPAP